MDVVCILSACRRGPESSGYIRKSTLSVGKVQSIKYKIRSSGYIRDSWQIKVCSKFLQFMPRGSGQAFVTFNKGPSLQITLLHKQIGDWCQKEGLFR